MAIAASGRILASKMIGTTGTGKIAKLARAYGSSSATPMPMKAGTSLKSLGVIKDQDPPVVKEREEYPAWVGELATPPPGLAVLRRIPNEEAEDKDIMRYLKLNRRQRIREQNEQSAV